MVGSGGSSVTAAYGSSAVNDYGGQWGRVDPTPVTTVGGQKQAHHGCTTRGSRKVLGFISETSSSASCTRSGPGKGNKYV
uniref:Uncharacterized protein n=1 Tax=Oryza sativa subsp. japonica TaxID=39947 RepID=Q6ZIJ2_ORYSJ|nr:hypothetical protein [Oryza sativa Japonica Group]